MRHLFGEHTQSPARLAGAVGLGCFCGIAPIWGYQMLVAALLAHKLRLNKAIAVTASNISFPLAAPFILASGLLLGHYLRTGQWFTFSTTELTKNIPLYLWDWVLGSFVLAAGVGALGAAITYGVARFSARRRPVPADA